MTTWNLTISRSEYAEAKAWLAARAYETRIHADVLQFRSTTNAWSRWADWRGSP